jgi:2-polyprenyl-3-methyl-5-hydroxy-6-metoxy-1,4-benzoquinol methylase
MGVIQDNQSYVGHSQLHQIVHRPSMWIRDQAPENPKRPRIGLSNFRLSRSATRLLARNRRTALAIRDHVAAGDTVYDIGANIGYVSLSLAKRVGPGGKVIAFEPVPRNIEALRQNIEINGLTNVRLLEVAASTYAGEAVIRMAENPSTASLAGIETIPPRRVLHQDHVHRRISGSRRTQLSAS